MNIKNLVQTITTGLAQKAKSAEATAAADLTKVKNFVTKIVTDAETIEGWAEELLAGKVPTTTNPTLQTIFEIIVRLIPFLPGVTKATIIADLTEAMNYLNDVAAFIALL